MYPIVQLEPFNDWEGLYCPACGEEIAISSSPCKHVTFVCDNESNDFDYISKKLKPVAAKIQSIIRGLQENDEHEIDIKKYLISGDIDLCPTEFIFEVIFPDATGFGQLIHYFGIDFDVEDEDEDEDEENNEDE